MSRLWLAVVVVLIIGSVGQVFTAGNTVPPTSAGISFVNVGPNEIKPPECAGISLEKIIIVTHHLHVGLHHNDLVIGSSTVSVLDGGAGDDCLVTGHTAAVLHGGHGDDVCIGPATTVFHDCETQIIRQ